MSDRTTAEFTCKQLVELITDYLEGRLPAEDRSRFEQHLLYCDGCGNYLLQIRGTIEVSHRAAEAQLEPRMEQVLLAAFRGWKKG